MKLRNKKTGEIGNLLPWVDYKTKKEMSHFAVMLDNRKEPLSYNSLAELNEEWEDYEELKGSALNLMILTLTNFIENEPSDNVDLNDCKNMLEKLKAWQRLKDKGFEFIEWYNPAGCEAFIKVTTNIVYDDVVKEDLEDDLNLLFSLEDK